MTHHHRLQEEVELIRRHPAFRAMVDELTDQTSEQLESFMEDIKTKAREEEYEQADR